MEAIAVLDNVNLVLICASAYPASQLYESTVKMQPAHAWMQKQNLLCNTVMRPIAFTLLSSCSNTCP